ncbi:MAG: MAPEG family protein, partial [Akkermansiaceae bacterium]|nr:MAPEG family protein [Akkermansiaceae bacterium]
ILANARLVTAMQTGKSVNTFAPDGSDVEGFVYRLTRAHLNCLELLPVAAAVILAAAVSGNSA